MIFPFLERARRRYLRNELFAQFAFGAALLLGGVILLLLAGTQLLDWRLVAVLVCLGFSAAMLRAFRRVPSPYRLAMLLDRRAGLSDALSTAVHFSTNTQAVNGLPAIREFQRNQTERMIGSVDLKTALPFQVPRALYVMGLLGLVASSLFALRYGIRRSLDLKAPLTQVVMDGFGLHAPEDKVKARTREARGRQPDLLDENGLPLERSGGKRAGELEPASVSALQTVGDPDVNNENAHSTSAGKEGNAKGEGSSLEAGEKSESGKTEGGQPQAGSESAANPSGSRDGPDQGEQGAGQQSSQSSPGLLSKMKEAMQNLMSKAMPQKNSASGQKQSGAAAQPNAQQQAKSGEKGAPGESKDGGQSEQAEGQQGQQAGDQESAGASQGKGSGKSAEQQSAAQPGSGVGKQDGEKTIRAAEQKAAMGKLSEVIGKRSINVSGEMMLESQSGPQQLSTQYTRRSATHVSSGGDMSRDEVPVELQGYVQQYFEEVRKAERAHARKAVAAPK